MPEPPSGAVIVVDLLSREELDALRPQIRRLFVQAKNKDGFLLGVLSAGNFTPLGPYKTAAALDKDLREAVRKPEEDAAVDALRLYGALPRAFSAPEDGNWVTVTFAGRWPEVPERLRDYTAAWLSRAFAGRMTRPVLWSPEGTRPGFLESVEQRLPAAPAIPPEVITTGPRITDGFVLAPAVLKDSNGEVAGKTVDLVVKEGFTLPSPEEYARLREAVDAAKEGRVEMKILAEALAFNPRDVEGLTVAAGLAMKAKDHAASARWLEGLVELEPDNAGRWREYALALYARGPAGGAEAALKRARELNPKDPLLAENLGRVRLGQRDIPGALRLFDESLAMEPANQDLWWISADLAKDTGDPAREIRSLQAALKLNTTRLDRRTRLIALLLDAKETARARPYADSVWTSLPAEVTVLSEYAQFWEALGEPERSLELWKRATGVDAAYEPGYYHAARLLLAARQDAAALAAADAGLAKSPDSARVQLARADALERLGRVYDSRRSLEAAAVRLKDPGLLRRQAAVEDLFGWSAAEAYQRLAQALPAGEERQAALARGELVALRDNDAARAAWFLERMPARPPPKIDYERLPPPPLPVQTPAPVPGGLAGLAFAAHARKPSSAEEFFYEYSRTLVDATSGPDKKAVEAYQEDLFTYFGKVRQLESWGKREGEHTIIRLSLKDLRARQQAEKVVEFLGYKLKTSKNRISLEAGEKAVHARRQELLSALGIDSVGMEEAIEAGRDYDLELDTGQAPVLLGAAAWMKDFAPKGAPAGGFAELLVRDPGAAKLYAGLSAAEPRAAEQLASRIGLRKLADNFADLVFAYGPAFAIDDRGAVQLPGGAPAAPVWRAMVLPNLDPALFFFQLLQKDGGKLLAFYSNLAQLDPVRQRFFTRTLERAQAYYALFKESPEMKAGAGKRMRQASFLSFLREIPLTPDGAVRFPGSPEVWTVARGTSGLEKTQKMMRKVEKAVAPAEEDEILVRMARQRYSSNNEKVSQLDNFLAVARLDARRRDPLTEGEALLLAQSLAEFHGTYPYFAVLTALKETDYTRFVRFARQVRERSDAEANLLLAHFHGVTELLCLLQLNGALAPADSAARFSDLCERLGGTGGPAEWALAASTVLVETKKQARLDDGQWAGALAGPSAARRDEMRKFLLLQKAPDLDRMLGLVAAAQGLAGKPAALAAELEQGYGALPKAAPAKGQKTKPELRKVLEAYSAPDGPRLVAEVKKRAIKKKPNPKDFEKLSHDLLADLSAPLALSVVALDYGYFLRPSDLVAAEDPLLVRKHQFIDLDSEIKKASWFPDADFEASSEGIGSFAKGSLGGFAVQAGRMALAGASRAGGSSELVQAMQTAAVRAAPLWQLEVRDLRLLKLRVLAGREWVVEASRDPKAREALAEATVGLLSPSRRSRLLGALETSETASAWDVLSLGDLYWLGSRLPEGPWMSSSPVRNAVAREAAGGRTHLDILGPVPMALRGYPAPLFEPLPPYEDYERYLFPDRLSERVSEYKFYLAWLCDSLGLTPESMAALAEPLLERALEGLRMTDNRDWRSALRAWSALQPSWLDELSSKKPGAP